MQRQLRPISVIVSVVTAALLACTGLECVAVDSVADAPRKVSESSDAVEVSVSAIIGEEILADNARAVHQQAVSLPIDERLTFLQDWALPLHRSTPRISGLFKRTGQIATGDLLHERLICPASLLVDTAAQNNTLEALRRRVGTFPDSLPRTTFLLLIDVAAKQFDSAEQRFSELAERFAADQTLSNRQAWCYLLAGLQTPQIASLRQPMAELMAQIDESCFGVTPPNTTCVWRYEIAAVARRKSDAVWTGEALDEWGSTTHSTSRLNSTIVPPARWVHEERAIHDRSGNPHHFLYYRTPLRGNFEVTGEVKGNSLRELPVLFAGEYVVPRYRMLRIGNVRQERGERLEKPIRTGNWWRFRIAVINGTCSTWFNGIKVRERTLPDNHDPWLAIRSGTRLQGTIRHVQIAGDVSVPKSVNMMPTPEMTGWIPYHGGQIGTEHTWAGWKIDDSTPEPLLIGTRRGALSGTQKEDLLRYHRPISEDGTIDYEFFYQPGRVHAHPAIGTRAYILNEDGVSLHQITDGSFETRSPEPDTTAPLPDKTVQLPLRAGAWNKMQLHFSGRNLSLKLNDVVIHSSELPASPLPTFGLFHYADQTTARIRKLTWTGNWPTTIPSISEQALSNDLITTLDSERDKLADVFRYDFTTNGLSEKFFTTSGVRQHFQLMEEDGVVVRSVCRGDWASGNLVPNFNIQGDFDATVTYSDLKFDAPGETGARLFVVPGDKHSHDLRIGRLRQLNGDHEIKAMASHIPRQGRIPKGVFHLPGECMSGRLRIARRGNNYYYLFSEGDSDTFYLAGQETGPTTSLGADGMHLSSMCLGQGSFSVCWKDFMLAAEQLELRITEGGMGPRAVYVMSVPDDDTDANSDKPLWQKYCEQRINQFELVASSNGETVVKRQPKPVMFHRQANFSDGLIYLWTQPDGQPVAIGTVLVEDENAEGGFREVDEFHSLHDDSLRMTDRGTEVWNVSGAGLTWHEIPEAPAPAGTADELYRQAEELSHRFSCSIRRPNLTGPPLQSDPIYRYSHTDNGHILGGILTAFSRDANPEVLLSLKVRMTSTGKRLWHFAGANYTGSNGYLMLDGRTVWQEAPAQFGSRSPHRGWFPHENLKLADGIAATAVTDVRKVADIPAGYNQIGSAEWTYDGQDILCDTVTGGFSTSRIALVDAEGRSNWKIIAPGMMPSLSPDREQLACSASGKGVMTMNADGTEMRQLDAGGWGIQWSPDGRFLAWGKRNNFVIMNVRKGDKRDLLTAEQTAEIGRLYWNHSWSHDSRSLAFKATDKTGRNVVAVADVLSTDGFRIIFTGECGAKMTWHPNNQHVCFNMLSPSTRTHQLYATDRSGTTPPERVHGQPADWNVLDADWSDKHNQIVFCGEPPAAVLQWPLTEEATE